MGSGFRFYIPKQEVIPTIKRCRENELGLGRVIDKVSPTTKIVTGCDNMVQRHPHILIGLAAFNK